MLRKLNGWQRIWVVLTILMVLYAVGFSYFSVFNHNSSSWEYRQAIIKDLSSSCGPYVTTVNVGRLAEPPYSNGGGTCWYIYTSRKLDKSTTVPYTIHVYDADKRTNMLGEFALATTLFGSFALVVSGLIYLAGFTVGWIRRGFYKTM